MTDEPSPASPDGGAPGASPRAESASPPVPSGASAQRPPSAASRFFRALRETALIVVVALVASALLRAFVVQAFFVPSGSMLPEIHLDDRILVSRIGDVQRGEVVVFEDPGGWIPAAEQAPPPGGIRKAFEFVGVLPASGHEHLVKRVIGLPGDHVVCCSKHRLTINGERVNESDFLFQKGGRADNVDFDVVVPADHIFVLGDHRYVSGDSSRQIRCDGTDAGFVPMDLVTGRAFAVMWPLNHAHILHIPDAYDDVPAATSAPQDAVVKVAGTYGSCSRQGS